MRLSQAIDLKLRLTLRVAALAALCFTAAAAYALFDSDRTARAKAEWIAGLVGKDLALQEAQTTWLKLGAGRGAAGEPDLQRIATPLMEPGLCIAYRSEGGETRQRVCSGTEPGETTAPALFAALYGRLFDPGAETIRPVLLDDKPHGTAVVTLDPASRIGRAWHDIGPLLAIMAVTLVALCLLVHAALARALRPTRVIRSGLERLAADDLSTRLPPFDLAELSAIRGVFNRLAETLQTTLAERNELTQRLIAVQDEERRSLARELHDEFGQCLAAIGAIAASIEQTARTECPALLPDCASIARITAQMMACLRGALARLRPADVEELGLAGSLESLISGWNLRSGGRTRFDIEVSGRFDALPAPFGTNLYRIAQEAVTNAARHAEATHVSLRLKLNGDEQPSAAASFIELTVEDDGKAHAADVTSKTGFGLLGMRERIASLGGRLHVEMRQPTGLILHAVVAAPRAQRDAAPARQRSLGR